MGLFVNALREGVFDRFGERKELGEEGVTLRHGVTMPEGL
jgi:hypothetical protein